MYLLVFDLGSLGPSTVTLMALAYVATCGGHEFNMIVNVKLLPENTKTIHQHKTTNDKNNKILRYTLFKFLAS